MSEKYNTNQAARIFNVSPETIRAWSEEFNDYLSPTANPGKGRNRILIMDDLQVFALIAELKRLGQTFSDIHSALRNGQRGEVPDISPEEIQALAVADQERRLALELEHMRGALAKLQQEYDKALIQLEEVRHVRDENIQLQVELKLTQQRMEENATQMSERLREAEQKVKELADERADLHKQLGQAQGELTALMRLLKMRGDIKDE